MYFKILGLSLRSRMSFRSNFFVMLAATFIKEFANLALMLVVVQRFDGLAGWTAWEIGFIYSIVTFSVRNFWSFFGGVLEIGNLVRTGDMDEYMLTPLNPLFLINSRNTMVWRAYYNIGILFLALYCGMRAGIVFGFLGIASFSVMMISSMLILFSLNLIVGTLAFFIVEVSAVTQVIEEIVKKYMYYPINIFGPVMSFVLTFIVPLGFIAYYPGAYMLGKSREIIFNPVLGILTPIVSLVWTAAALLLWKHSARSYQSTGT